MECLAIIKLMSIVHESTIIIIPACPISIVNLGYHYCLLPGLIVLNPFLWFCG